MVDDTGKSGILGRERRREVALAAPVVMGEPWTAEAKNAKGQINGAMLCSAAPRYARHPRRARGDPPKHGYRSRGTEKIGMGGPGIV